MLKTVKKRDGRIVNFNELNIRRAITKANDTVPISLQANDDEIDEIINDIKTIKQDCVHIEVIQDMIENALMDMRHHDLARNYITYRYKQNINRQLSASERNIMELIRGTNKEIIDENSNKNSYTNSTQRDLMAGEISKDISKRILLPEDIIAKHEACIYHWHDMDYSAQEMINCCLINVKSILDYGTMMNGALIESPRSFRTACIILAQCDANVASNQYGGQSMAIKHLGKYVAISRERLTIKQQKRWDKAGISYTDEQLSQVVADMLDEEIKDGVQSLQYMSLTLVTTNGQAPFITLFMHIDEEDEYTDEIAMVVREIIRQRDKGLKNKDGKYVTPSFPKLIYVVDENNYKAGTKYWDITQAAARCSIKRSYPDYISAKKMRELYEGNVFSPMGCRSFLAPWKKTAEYCKLVGEPDTEVGKYLFEGRFNQGVVSINLPQIAIEADHDMNKFFELLNIRLADCYKALLFRHKMLLGTKAGTSPMHWMDGAICRLDINDTIDWFLNSAYSTISLGYIGIYEMTYAMLGVSHTDPAGLEFALKVMHTMRDHCDMWKKQTGLGFALYGTPAESLCYRFCKHDLEKYGSIPNVTDKGYYTNSYHIDVREHVNAFDKFKFESQFQKISSGGCISYCEIPNLEKNAEAIEKLISYIYDNIMYAEFNSKSDYCYECGWDGEILLNSDNQWECPNCHNKDKRKMIIVRRTCGYLGSNEWNEGKRKEIGQRVMHL